MRVEHFELRAAADFQRGQGVMGAVSVKHLLAGAQIQRGQGVVCADDRPEPRRDGQRGEAVVGAVQIYELREGTEAREPVVSAGQHCQRRDRGQSGELVVVAVKPRQLPAAGDAQRFQRAARTVDFLQRGAEGHVQAGQRGIAGA